MKKTLIVLALCAAVPLTAQSWATPTGTAYAALVRGGGADQSVALATLPATGEAGIAEESSASLAGKFAAGMSTAVTSGAASADRAGVQSVATVTNVNVLNGLIKASKVVAISMLSQNKNRTMTDADGSAIEGLTVNGVSVGSPAPGTRMELPGVGYVMLNEQISPKGRGTTFTVNMIHVYMVNSSGTTTSEIIVGSATSSTGM